jgi:hypothetical protein
MSFRPCLCRNGYEQAGFEPESHTTFLNQGSRVNARDDRTTFETIHHFVRIEFRFIARSPVFADLI